MRRTLGVLGGAVAWAMAMPPADQAIFGWFTLVPLLVIVRRVSPKAALGWGAAFGFCCGWAVTWWLAIAVAGFFASGVLTGALLMSAAYLTAVSSTFAAFAAGACWLLRREPGLRGRVAVAALWTATELVRARVFAQPWALLGYTQHGVVPLIQVVAVTGVLGLSFLVAFASDGIAAAWVAWRCDADRGGALRALLAPAAMVSAVGIAGLLTVPPPDAGVAPEARRVQVVQSNVPPAFRWTRAYAEEQLLANVRLTERGAGHEPTALLVWPENALTLYLEHEPWVVRQLGRIATARHADLLLGGPRSDGTHTFNSAHLVRPGGTIAGHVDKRRLVLFAEAPPLDVATAEAAEENPHEFTPGSGTGVLPGFAPLGVTICQEALYPDVPASSVRDGAAVLVNLANDGWLDQGWGVGSRQHAAMVALRAVESRRWLVRAATTGVSMIVDPWGRVVRALPTGVAGVTEARVVPRDGWTPYVRWGDAFGVGCMLLAGAVMAPHAFVQRRQRRTAPAGATA